MTVNVTRTVIKNSHRRIRAKSGEQYAVRFTGVPKVTYELAGKKRKVSKPAGDVKLLRDFHDTPLHELNALIALRDAKALAMSLGIHCRFEWPVLWRKDDAIICSAPPGGPKKDFTGKGIMPVILARSDAIKELDASWEKQVHFGLVPDIAERASHRPPPPYAKASQPAATGPLSDVKEWLIDRLRLRFGM
jgi:hypothetical protein